MLDRVRSASSPRLFFLHRRARLPRSSQSAWKARRAERLCPRRLALLRSYRERRILSRTQSYLETRPRLRARAARFPEFAFARVVPAHESHELLARKWHEIFPVWQHKTALPGLRIMLQPERPNK